MVNKKAWMRTVEAFLAATFIIIVLVLVVNNQSSQNKEVSSQIYNSELSILRYIELNSSLRGEIISSAISSSELPLNSDSTGFPSLLNSAIQSKTPGDLICKSQICEINSACNYWGSADSSIYARQIFVTSTNKEYNPRELRLFCLVK